MISRRSTVADAPTMRGNWRVYHHATIDSTNLEALRLATREALPWTAVIADTQTEGRGRLGRTWLDRPRRCLLLTALVYPPPGSEGLLGAAMALAVARTLEKAGTCEVAIKWPNDVILGDRKIAGILVEGPNAGLMAVGIGLNVNSPPDALPANLQQNATFVSEEISRELELLPLADAVLAHFECEHFRLMSDEVAEVLEDVREFDCLSGREIRARSGNRVIEGRAVGWTDDGRLAIIDTDGDEIALDAGEVTLS
jgi:BirA family transcriptional regulator, biotin operon repressor / biotin---[acetyl-CoA-carboxylase] ligase